MSDTRRILVLLSAEAGLSGELLTGVMDIAHEHSSWLVHPVVASAHTSIASFKPAAVIGDLSELKRKDLPRACAAVDLGQRSPRRGAWPQVAIDHAAGGAMVAEHLLERGWRRFAFIGKHSSLFSDARLEGYRNALDAQGHRCQSWYTATTKRVPWPMQIQADERNLTTWLAKQGLPLAVFAGKDDTALLVQRCARSLGWQAGIDYALVACRDGIVPLVAARPAISALRLPGREQGRRAARSVLRQLAGEAVDRELLAPLEVVVRASSSARVTGDPLLTAAHEHIRAYASRGLTVGALVRALKVDRRLLERRFHAAGNSGPAGAIRDERLAQAKNLLADTALPISTIALRVGFASATRFAEAFRRRYRCTPSAYRAQLSAT
jgi:LacI family transcriptional regulator